VFRRRAIFSILIISLAPALFLTRALVAAYRTSRQDLAESWAARGERDLVQRKPFKAVDDYRTALTYARDAAGYRLRLAQALLASNHPTEAEAHLLTLWSGEPGNGTVNLELGRIAAAQGDVAAATRYYHAAIDGAWEREAAQSRRTARLELAAALIAARQYQGAQAELIALSDDLPDDAVVMTKVGEELTRAGSDTRALAMFRRALAVDPSNVRAAALAGQSAFRLGDYSAARNYLDAASRQSRLDAEAAEQLQVSARILALDPFARGISLRERARRTLALFDAARARLDRCQTASTPAQAQALGDLAAAVADIAPRLERRALARDGDLLDRALDIALKVEVADCGEATVDDRALQIIARGRTGATAR